MTVIPNRHYFPLSDWLESQEKWKWGTLCSMGILQKEPTWRSADYSTVETHSFKTYVKFSWHFYFPNTYLFIYFILENMSVFYLLVCWFLASWYFEGTFVETEFVKSPSCLL